ncbi:MAG TPA: FAD-dependent oxidoreductase [Ramlibacter sp.]|nr:FAD-dependent oxidoreductase [Ramlibacter sp.]
MQVGKQSSAHKKVAIIGAGSSGVCLARYLIEEGADVTVFEAGSHIGGMWVYENDSGVSPAYKTLHINSPKSLTAFPDHPFPKETQLFPSHRDMHAYLVSYADRFGVTPRIRFNTRVKAVVPLFRPGVEAPKWEVMLEDGTCDVFEHVVCATGHLTVPRHAPELRDNYKGEYLHSFNYRDPADYARKRVCVVGVGNSAMDIASDVCCTSPDTTLVARTGVVIVPKLLMGVCVTDYLVKLYEPWVPGWVRRKVGGFVTWLAHGRMDQYGFKPVTKATHGTTSAVLCTHIAYDRVKVKQGIDRIEGKRIHFVDGTSAEYDVMIAATGYMVDLPFLSPDVVPVDQKTNKVDLYKRMAAPGWPNLWFMGFCNATTALNHMFLKQAIWTKEHIMGRAVLPTEAEMRQDIERKRSYIHGKYLATPRHELEEEHGTYFLELKKALKEGRQRAGQGGGLTQGQMFNPLEA